MEHRRRIFNSVGFAPSIGEWKLLRNHLELHPTNAETLSAKAANDPGVYEGRINPRSKCAICRRPERIILALSPSCSDICEMARDSSAP